MVQTIYVNAATLTKTLAGGKHVHIDLIMKDTVYNILVEGTTW